jgi:DNA-binding transcriptional LysR family regulator
MINLEWLRTFSTIYECNSITEASKKLNMTQPGVSKHLLALESHIGKKLFERTTRKLVATEYGKFLYSQIIVSIQQLQKVEYYSNRRVKKERASITIGCTSDFFNSELIHRIYAFDMYIVTRYGSHEVLVEALEKDEIQLAVGIKKHSQYNHEFEYIKDETLQLICSHTIVVPKEIEKRTDDLIQWLQKQTWFVYDNDLADIKKYWKANFNTDPKIIPRYILPSYSDTLNVLMDNEGFSIVTQQSCQDKLERNLIKIPIKSTKTVSQKLYFSFKQKNSNLKEIMLFMEQMKKTVLKNFS